MHAVLCAHFTCGVRPSLSCITFLGAAYVDKRGYKNPSLAREVCIPALAGFLRVPLASEGGQGAFSCPVCLFCASRLSVRKKMCMWECFSPRNFGGYSTKLFQRGRHRYVQHFCFLALQQRGAAGPWPQGVCALGCGQKHSLVPSYEIRSPCLRSLSLSIPEPLTAVSFVTPDLFYRNAGTTRS